MGEMKEKCCTKQFYIKKREFYSSRCKRNWKRLPLIAFDEEKDTEGN